MRTDVSLQHRGSVYAGKRLTMNSQSGFLSQPPAKRQKVDGANPYLSATGPPFRGAQSRKNKDGLLASSSSSTQLSKKDINHIASPPRAAPIEISDDELDTKPATTFKGKAPIRVAKEEPAVAPASASARGPSHSASSSAGQASTVMSVPAPATTSMQPAASTSVPVQEVTATPATPLHNTPVPPQAVDGGVPAREQSISDSTMDRLLDLRERSLKTLTEEQLPYELRAENVTKLLARVAANMLDPRVA
ncbi:hypothetical protein PENSPDRAFT_654899 [Peniophora sp. CONT]|nr:hypothetical protein PENSPDRAFT_654899 [Peniophora sp. CONT]